MQKVKIRNSLLLLLTATIWGTAFVAQSVGMDYVEPFTFNMVRSLLGGLVLIPCILVLNKFFPRNVEKANPAETPPPESCSGKEEFPVDCFLPLPPAFSRSVFNTPPWDAPDSSPPAISLSYL